MLGAASYDPHLPVPLSPPIQSHHAISHLPNCSAHAGMKPGYSLRLSHGLLRRLRDGVRVGSSCLIGAESWWWVTPPCLWTQQFSRLHWKIGYISPWILLFCLPKSHIVRPSLTLVIRWLPRQTQSPFAVLAASAGNQQHLISLKSHQQ